MLSEIRAMTSDTSDELLIWKNRKAAELPVQHTRHYCCFDEAARLIWQVARANHRDGGL